MYVQFRATQGMNQEFKFKTAQNSKNLRLFYSNDMSLYHDKNRVCVFLWKVLLTVRMVADVIETRNVIPSLELKT